MGRSVYHLRLDTLPYIILASSIHSSRVTVFDLLSATAESGNMDLTFLFFLEDEAVSRVTENSKVLRLKVVE